MKKRVIPMNDIPVEVCYEVLGRVVRQAIRDSRQKGRKLTKTQLIDKRDAKEFLFTKRLDNFINRWKLPLNSQYIRTISKKREAIPYD